MLSRTESIKNKLNLISYFLKKDIKAKYAGSGLGMFWTVIMPLIQILLFWLVFSAIMKARPYANTQMPYIYFLLSSFFFWLAFSEGLIRASSVIIENAEMVKKVSFSNVVLPVTVTLSSYIHHIVGFLIFIIIYSIIISFNPIFLLVIPVLFFQILFSLGLGMLLSALIPYIRDIGQILGPILQGTFFLSPIIYSIEFVPEKLRMIFYLNPITYFASSYQRIILLKEVPSLFYISIIVSLSIGSLIFGFFVFKKLKEGFSDVL
jgi:lipopolysaccharide transport system permease protein